MTKLFDFLIMIYEIPNDPYKFLNRYQLYNALHRPFQQYSLTYQVYFWQY